MVKHSSEATSLSGRRPLSGYPSMTTRAIRNRKLLNPRTRSNRKSDGTQRESAGNGDPDDNGRSTEVSVGGSCKSDVAEVQKPAMHTTYAALAKARAARKLAYEEKMLNFKQNMINSKLKQSTQAEEQNGRKFHSVQCKTKLKKESVLVLGLKRQTNGDLLIASLNSSGSSILDKTVRVLGISTYEYHTGSGEGKLSDGVSRFNKSQKSEKLLEPARDRNIAKYRSSHLNPAAKLTSTPKTHDKALCNENSEGNFGLKSKAKFSPTDVLACRLTPTDSMTNTDSQVVVHPGRDQTDKEHSANTENLLATRNNVNKEIRSNNLDISNNKTEPRSPARYGTLNSNLETAHLENLLDELETTLESLQQGRSPSNLELSSHLGALGKISVITSPALQKVRTRDDADGTILRKELNKKQLGSQNFSNISENPKETQPEESVTRNKRFSRKSHLPSRKSLLGVNDTKDMYGGQKSQGGCRKKMLLAKFNKNTQLQREKSEGDVSAISNRENIKHNHTSIDSKLMGVRQPKIKPPAESKTLNKDEVSVPSESGKASDVCETSVDASVKSYNVISDAKSKLAKVCNDTEILTSGNLPLRGADVQEPMIPRSREHTVLEKSDDKELDKIASLSNQRKVDHQIMKDSEVSCKANPPASGSITTICFFKDVNKHDVAKLNVGKDANLPGQVEAVKDPSMNLDKETSIARTDEELKNEVLIRHGGSKSYKDRIIHAKEELSSIEVNSTESHDLNSETFPIGQHNETLAGLSYNEDNSKHAWDISTRPSDDTQVETSVDFTVSNQRETSQGVTKPQGNSTNNIDSVHVVETNVDFIVGRQEEKTLDVHKPQGNSTNNIDSVHVVETSVDFIVGRQEEKSLDGNQTKATEAVNSDSGLKGVQLNICSFSIDQINVLFD